MVDRSSDLIDATALDQRIAERLTQRVNDRSAPAVLVNSPIRERDGTHWQQAPTNFSGDRGAAAAGKVLPGLRRRTPH
jgi:hypothetical protein